MATSWYKKCDGQKPEKNKYVNPLIDSGHYILFVDTHLSAQEFADSFMHNTATRSVWYDRSKKN